MLKITETTCEFCKDPIGLGCKKPRFFWKTQSGGIKQTSYRIVVSSEKEGAEKGRGDIYDSGTVFSSEAFYAEYGGKELVSRQKCYWKVYVGFGDCVAESRVNSFEMGLLSETDWKGTWMSLPVNHQGGTALYRKKITVKEKPLKRARAYICGIGYNEAFCNGRKIGSAVLDPAITEYAERVFYRTHDITPLLRKGDNVFGVEIGHGWYGAKKTLVQIYIDYLDGETEEFHSSVNGGWWVAGSPTVDNSIYGGEVYDARIEDKIPKNWASCDYEPTWDKGWMFTVYASPPQGKLEPQTVDPIEVCGEYPPVSVTEKKKGVFVFDVGRNISGWARIRVRGSRGARVTLKFGERLTLEGYVNRCNLRSAAASDTYILKGQNVEEYAPRFTYHGFQYIQAETEGDCEILSLCGEHVHTNVRIAGSFKCSDDVLNRLHENAVVTELNNEQGILTDCPQRDERFGWLNDLSARLYQTLYNCGMERFFPKFTRDITHTQLEGGEIGDTAPYFTGGRPADPVCVSYLLMPLFSYIYYGDKRCAEEEYGHCKAWGDYLLSRSRGYIMDYSYYADWVAPDCFNVHTDNIYVSTVFLYWHLKSMKKLAEITGRNSDAALYGEKAELCARAINEKYFDPVSCNYAEGTQSANSLALSLGIVPPEYRARVAKNVADNVIALGYHSSCGNVGYRHLFYVLGDYGYTDVALKMLKNPEYPGWGYMLANGATSVWERWESEMSDEMDSFDHPMFGSYDAFFYRYLAGISVDESAFACDKITLAPVFAEGIDEVCASFDTVRGKIVSEWKREGDKIICRFAVPDQIAAKIILGAREFTGFTGECAFILCADGSVSIADTRAQ